MVKNETLNKIFNNPVRDFKDLIKVYIWNKDGTYKICTSRDELISFTIERVGENKFFGYGICQRLNIKLRDTYRTTNISTANYIEFYLNGYTFQPFPPFYVTEVHRDETNNQLSVTAYDAIYSANKYTFSDLNNHLNSSYTIRDVVRACAMVLGLPYTIDSDNEAFNLSYSNGVNFEGTEPLRDVMNAIAEATQTIYFIGKDLELTFKSLDVSGDPDYIIGKSSYLSLNSKTNRRLRTICHVTELGDNISASIAQSGTTQYVRDNPFWNTRDDVATLVQNAIDRIGGFTINQFECTWRGNWLVEIGDCIGLITKDDNTVISYLLNDEISFDGSLIQKSKWVYDDNEEETEINPISISDALKSTFAKVDKVNREIELCVSNIDETRAIADNNTVQLSQLKLTTDNISATVENKVGNVDDRLGSIEDSIETISDKVAATMTSEEVKLLISTETSKGSTNVVTSTGFTFDEYGLKVSKNTSDISTTISEDGMLVTKNEDVMLTADSQGVIANNLRSNYIIISDRCRFEKYGSHRVGCYWIGDE